MQSSAGHIPTVLLADWQIVVMMEHENMDLFVIFCYSLLLLLHVWF
jgi:hypothetical protein